MSIQEEIFLVMSNRKGGKMPSVVKSTERMFFLLEDAVRYRDGMDDLSEYFGVYRAMVKVEERVQ